MLIDAMNGDYVFILGASRGLGLEIAKISLILERLISKQVAA